MPNPVSLDRSVLVGRDAELRRAVDGVRGDPGCVVLRGPAGIGKTHLATAVVAELDDGTRPVRRMVASAASRRVPLGALAPLLPVLPEPADAEGARLGADDRRLLRHAVDVIEAAAAERGLVLVIDDAQHLDPTSALVVSQLVAGRRVDALVTMRSSDPVPEPLGAWWDDGSAAVIELEAFDPERVHELLAAALGGPLEGATARRLGELSDGNPLFALELVAAADREGALARSDGLWRVPAGWRPSAGAGRLADLLADQVRALDADEREAIDLVALAGVLDRSDLEALVGPEVVDELARRAVLAVEGRPGQAVVRTRHPLIAELIRADIGSRRRRRLFGELAAAATPVERAGVDAAMQRALWVLESGADDPARFAWATRFARFAGELETGLRFAAAATDSPGGADLDPATRVEVAVLAGEMAYQLGRYDESDRWLRAGAEAARTDEELALVVINHLSTVYWGLGDEAACEALIDDFRERHPDSPWAADLAGLRATLAVFSGRPRLALEGLAPLRRRDDDRAVVEVALVEAGALTETGATDRAVEVATAGYQRHLAIGEQIGLGASGIHLLTSLSALSIGGRLDEAEALGAALHQAVVAMPNPFGLVLVAHTNGRTALARGRPRTAERWFREGAVAARAHLPGDQLRWCLGGLALALALRGEVREAAAVRDEARAIGGLARLHDIDLELAEAWIDAGTGDLTSPVAALVEAAARWAAAGFLTNEARALHACVSLDAAERVVERLGVVAELVDSPLVALAARQAVAAVERDVDELEAVAAAYVEAGAAFAAAEALAQAARLAHRAQRTQRAAGLDRRARELLAACEGARNPTLLEPVELAPLTRREREVALLAAQGLRSRDIAEQLEVSIRTVENHLHNVFSKLAVADRSELAAALGIDPGG